jgi:hypothetical protein
MIRLWAARCLLGVMLVIYAIVAVVTFVPLAIIMGLFYRPTGDNSAYYEELRRRQCSGSAS